MQFSPYTECLDRCSRLVQDDTWWFWLVLVLLLLLVVSVWSLSGTLTDVGSRLGSGAMKLGSGCAFLIVAGVIIVFVWIASQFIPGDFAEFQSKCDKECSRYK